MFRAGGLFGQGLRWQALAVAIIVATAALAADSADAKSRRHRRAAASSYNPPYAAAVIDANTGAVLHAANAESPRHPASLTKIMTLYMLFEQLESGKIKLSSELPVSSFAAAQAPSKLALKPGQTISVENAIRALVTKSANDVAVIVAEALGGDEEQFARKMTQKARALGMKNTVYRNASGLPDGDQVSTAHDQILLGRAIQDRFPRYYRYFSVRSFSFGGKTMRNHNKLLGRVRGVDGIKTGYTRDSGFNLVTSVRRGKHHIVAAVFGGRSASWRDARMHSLIEKYINKSSTKRTAAAVREIAPDPAPKAKEKDKEKKIVVSSAPVAKIASATKPQPGSREPIKATLVKTVTVRAANVRGTMLASMATSTLSADSPAKKSNILSVTTVKTEPPPAMRPDAMAFSSQSLKSASNMPHLQPDPPRNSYAKKTGGWMIQVGAFEDEDDAKRRLAAARAQADDALKTGDPFVESVKKGNKTLYRARFNGFEKDLAEIACKQLRRGEIPCMLLKN